MYETLNCIPVFNEDKMGFTREEKEGYSTFVSRKHPEIQALSMNSQAKAILRFCNGDNSIKMICNKIHNMYKNVLFDRVKKDVMQLLHIMWRLGVIEWNGDSGFREFYEKKMKNAKYKMLTEDEVIDVLQELRNKKCIPREMICDPYTNLESILSISQAQQNVFNGATAFFELQYDSKRIALISLSTPLDKRKSLLLSFIANFSEVDVNADEFLHWCSSTYGKLLNTKFTRVDVILQTEKLEKGLNVLREFNFTKLGILKDALILDEEAHNVQVLGFDLV